MKRPTGKDPPRTVEWHAYCCGGRVRPAVFKTRRAAEEYIEQYACDGSFRIVRVPELAAPRYTVLQ